MTHCCVGERCQPQSVARSVKEKICFTLPPTPLTTDRVQPAARPNGRRRGRDPLRIDIHRSILVRGRAAGVEREKKAASPSVTSEFCYPDQLSILTTYEVRILQLAAYIIIS